MKKILVVDDDKDILDMLRLFFQFNGFDIRISTACNDALNTFYRFLPDIVLLDMNVGSSDGRGMCRTIKAQAGYQLIPVILISANTENLSSYTDDGAYAGIEKPLNLHYLLSKVQAAMRSVNK